MCIHIPTELNPATPLIYRYIFDYDRFVDSEHYENASDKIRARAYREDGFVYIGSSKVPEKRHQQHKRSGNKPRTKWSSRIHDYGWDNFDYEILENCDGSYNDLLEMEQKWLDLENPFDFGYNTARSTKMSIEDIQALKNKKTTPIAVIRASDGILIKLYKSIQDCSEHEDVKYEQISYAAKKKIPYNINKPINGFIYLRLMHIAVPDLMLGQYIDLTNIVTITSKKLVSKYVFVDDSNTPRLITDHEDTAMLILGVTTKADLNLIVTTGRKIGPHRVYRANPNIKYILGEPIIYDEEKTGIDYSKMYLIYKNKLLIDQIHFKHGITIKYPELTRYIINKMIKTKTEHNGYYVKPMTDIKDTPVIGYSKLAIETNASEII